MLTIVLSVLTILVVYTSPSHNHAMDMIRVLDFFPLELSILGTVEQSS